MQRGDPAVIAYIEGIVRNSSAALDYILSGGRALGCGPGGTLPGGRDAPGPARRRARAAGWSLVGVEDGGAASDGCRASHGQCQAAGPAAPTRDAGPGTEPEPEGSRTRVLARRILLNQV